MSVGLLSIVNDLSNFVLDRQLIRVRTRCTIKKAMEQNEKMKYRCTRFAHSSSQKRVCARPNIDSIENI